MEHLGHLVFGYVACSLVGFASAVVEWINRSFPDRLASFVLPFRGNCRETYAHSFDSIGLSGRYVKQRFQAYAARAVAAERGVPN